MPVSQDIVNEKSIESRVRGGALLRKSSIVAAMTLLSRAYGPTPRSVDSSHWCRTTCRLSRTALACSLEDDTGRVDQPRLHGAPARVTCGTHGVTRVGCAGVAYRNSHATVCGSVYIRAHADSIEGG